MFDINRDGKISLQGFYIKRIYLILINFIYFIIEYIEGCKVQGNNSDDSVLQKVFNLFDVDKDGRIDEQEFHWALTYLSATEN